MNNEERRPARLLASLVISAYHADRRCNDFYPTERCAAGARGEGKGD